MGSNGIVWGGMAGIRPLRLTDAAAIQRFMLDPEVARLLFEQKSPIRPSIPYMFLSIALDRLNHQPDFGIVEPGGRLIGRVNLWRVSETNRSAMLSVYIGDPSCWGRGYGTEAVRLVLSEAFGRLNLNRIELHVFDFNQRAIRSYEKVGFKHEGVRRQALQRDGRFFDILVMGILREEYSARAKESPFSNDTADVGG